MGGNLGIRIEINNTDTDKPVISRTIWLIAQHGGFKGESFEDRLKWAREYMRHKLQIVRESEEKYEGLVDYTQGVETCQ